MLSATIPNYEDFAKWVGRIKNTIIYMQITNKRIVPLEHKIYLTDKEIYVCKDSKDQVIKDNIDKALRKLEDLNNKALTKGGGGGKSFNNKNFNKNFNNNNYGGGGTSFSYGNQQKGNQQKATNNKILEMAAYMIKNNLTPAVIFVFSLKKIDEYSKELADRVSEFNWATREDTSRIIKFFDKCMSLLSKKDQAIPQISTIKELLKRGIGIHHAGLLPIIKETIEILYSKGLIKILFATTSFAIGLNMPTRTVVFTEVTKFNDQVKEILSSSEYLQMCGRAGRRGIDDKGHAFILLGDKTNPPKADDLATMMRDGGTIVESRFRLSYKTILSILSRDIKEINQFFKESYLENKKMEHMPKAFIEKNKTQEDIRSLGSLNCIYGDYEDDAKHIEAYNSAIKKYRAKKSELWSNQLIKEYMNEGRLVKVKSSYLGGRVIIAMIVRYYFPPMFDEEYRIVYAESKAYSKTPIKIEINDICMSFDCKDKVLSYIQISPNEIEDVLELKFKLGKDSLLTDSNSFVFLNSMPEIEKISNDLIDLNLNKINDVKVLDYKKASANDLKVFQIVQEKEISAADIVKSKCHDCQYKSIHMDFYQKLEPLKKKFEELQNNLNTEKLKHSNEFNKRIKVLQQLNYVSKELTLEVKGKAARELSTTDCVMMTETLLSGVLDGLSIREKLAFMSGFAFSKNDLEKTDPKISKPFSVAVEKFSTLLEKIISLETKNELEENKYNRRCTFVISEAVLAWMEGAPFIDVLKLAQMEEGKLFTLIMRIFQLCDEIKSFFIVLNLEESAKSFEEAKGILMRDILSCKSLYLQDMDFNV